MAGKLAIAANESDDLLADLKRLGFTEYEAKIYIQLLRMPPSTAYEISKGANVPRPNTYHALEALAQRGAVLPVSENPVRYVAAPPNDFLAALSNQTRALCADLSERLSSIAPSSKGEYVWMLRGEGNVHSKIDTLIEESDTSIWIKASDTVLRRHKEALRKAAARGIEIFIVLFGPDAEEFRFGPTCRVYIHEGNGVRMGTTDNLFTVSIDHIETLTATVEGEVVAAYTRNGPIVNLAESLVRHDYYMAEIFARLGPQIDEAFGPYLRDLRLACFSPEQAASFKKRTGLS
ncbi:transcriptional regulator, TrmB [Ancylobacter novellus DSM 506]|uniref:Transcriptional regulator, TrmB n=1 Tax=Ancylobacter novellus (strain ATCC 8093 / DSM 506 / JCM 20403 / CCM 1077 / IAM 12100 / NBRC 12443 / NCIMB 10456) TaxID=639283 RepID=D7A2Y2_ANCN5|nr:TrmB family transcriptional regulator [Ancylobacter novellus]ADH87700.1 transcriptional regulator, TrmB [Ancylobacter novellus DSM 506]